MTTPRRRHHAPLRAAAAVATTAVLVLAAGGCGREDGAATDDSPRPAGTASGTVGTPSSTSPGTPSSTDPDTRDYPDFAPQDYTYRLEVLCYCPQVGAVRVTVTDGEVTSARTVGGRSKGGEAPEFARLSINDIIERANDPSVDDAQVTWPTGQDHPSVVALDQLANAIDDEVTYTIRNVRVR